MRPFVALILTAFLCVPTAFAQNLGNDDAAALKQLAQSNLTEIEAGKLAIAKAQSPDVRQFGQTMVNEHTQMLEDLRSLAKAKGVPLPDKATLKDMAQAKMLERKSGADFDREFMERMVKDHELAAKETEALAAKTKDAEFRAAMRKANGKIKEHLAHAQRLAGAAAAGATAK